MKCTKADLDNTVPIHPSLAEVNNKNDILGNAAHEMKYILCG